MTTITKRWVWSAAVMVVLTIPLLFTALPLDLDVEHATAKRDAVEWASRLSSEEVRAALSDIDRMSAPEQRALFAKLPPATQASYWETRINGFRARAVGLTPEKNAAIESAKQLLTPAFFEDPSSHRGRHREIMAALRSVLEPSELAAVAGSAPFVPKPTLRSRVKETIRNAFTASARQTTCECSQESPSPCGLTSLECSAQVNCEVAEDECWMGWLIWSDCYGLCGLPGMEG